MAVRAKFTITKIERTMGSRAKKDDDGNIVMGKHNYPEHEPCEMWTIHGQPVYGNGDPNHENTKFWASSPNGSLMLGTVNKDAVDQFELGKEYYVDFTPASE